MLSQSPPMTSVLNYAFVQIKSFGDLTISLAALRRLSAEDLAQCCVVLSPHLKDLYQALSPAYALEILDIPDQNVPAIFDVKKRGPMAALLSAMTLRRSLASSAPGATLVMERMTARERFVVGRRTGVGLPHEDNVYLAYERFLSEIFTLRNSALPQVNVAGTSRRIAVCPLSRVAAKNIPLSLILNMADVCHRAGFEIELLLLEGEPFDIPNALPTRVIARRFDALASALTSYAGVISADSLPAHLAEYRGRPAFVATPVQNTYWLPEQAYKSAHWGLFEQRADLTTRLLHFLDSIS